MFTGIARSSRRLNATFGAKGTHVVGHLAPSYAGGGERSRPFYRAACSVADRFSSEREMHCSCVRGNIIDDDDILGVSE